MSFTNNCYAADNAINLSTVTFNIKALQLARQKLLTRMKRP